MKHIAKIDIPVFPSLIRFGKLHLAVLNNNILIGKSAKHECAVCLYSFTGDLISTVELNIHHSCGMYLIPGGFAIFAVNKVCKLYSTADRDAAMQRPQGVVYVFDNHGNKLATLDTIAAPSVGIDGAVTVLSKNRLLIYADGRQLIHDMPMPDNRAISTLTYSRDRLAVISAKKYDDNRKNYWYKLSLACDGAIADEIDIVAPNIDDAKFCGECGQYMIVRSRVVINSISMTIPSTVIYTDDKKIKGSRQIWGYEIVGMLGDYPIAAVGLAGGYRVIGLMLGENFVEMRSFTDPITRVVAADRFLAVMESYSTIHIFDTTFDEDADRAIITRQIQSI